jgi:transposase
MEANMKRHEPYTQEYKLEAIQLAQTQGTAKTAASLGLNVNMLGRWKREHETRTAQGKPVFTGRGVEALTDQEKEIKQLRKELEIARQERDILKKAVAFFAKDSH